MRLPRTTLTSASYLSSIKKRDRRQLLATPVRKSLKCNLQVKDLVKYLLQPGGLLSKHLGVFDALGDYSNNLVCAFLDVRTHRDPFFLPERERSALHESTVRKLEQLVTEVPLSVGGTRVPASSAVEDVDAIATWSDVGCAFRVGVDTKAQPYFSNVMVAYFRAS